MNPLDNFRHWFSEEKERSNLKFPAACCLSTIGLDGYPNSRFVSLKEVSKESFIITGSMNSRKWTEIENCPKASLTFWWSSTERQIRIQGNVSKILESEAESFFEQRSRDSQIVSSIFNQGKEIESIESLKELFKQAKETIGQDEIDRPKNWGGIKINPIRIEFMDFKQSRLHERRVFIKEEETWTMKVLQP